MILASLALCAALVPDTESVPDIVFILVDDMGWMDLGCQGNAALDTPHIDALARAGVRFTDAYAPAPTCSPTRAALMTGRSPAGLRITNHIPDRPSFARARAPLVSAETRDRLTPEHETLAEHLRAAGYATGFFGKWHLAGPGGSQGLGDLDCYPEAQGFDVNLGGTASGGPPTYWDPYRIHSLPPRREGEYLPERLVDEVLAFLDDHTEQPTFTALWNYAVHYPMEAPEELVEKYAQRIGPGVKDARYAAMIEALDTALGRLFAGLEERGRADNTLVVFTSDNGGWSGPADNAPLREGKGYLYEGGTRVPLIVRWPGIVEPGSISHAPVIGTDLFPTLLAAANAGSEAELPTDGFDLTPHLRGGTAPAREALYWHAPNYAWHGDNRLGSAVRVGDHKLIERFADGSLELYDLAADIAETENLAATQPELAAELHALLRAWRQEQDAALPTAREEQ